MTTNDRKPNILDAFIDESIEEKPIWKPMHMQPVFKDSIFIEKGSKDYSASIYEDGICLASGSDNSLANQNRIIDILLSLIKSI